MKNISASILSLALGVSVSSGQIVSINFGPSGDDLAAGDLAGVVAAGNWNNLTGTNDPSSSDLLDSSGASTGITMTQLAGAQDGGALNGLQFNDGSNGRDYSSSNVNVRMMNGFIFSQNDTAMTFSITNISSAFTSQGYDVYFYYDRPNEDQAELSLTPLGGSAMEIDTAEDTTGPFSGTVGYSFVEGDNYYKFSGLTAASFDFVIGDDTTDSNSRTAFNGLQLVAVPEPSSFAILCGMGALWVASFRRRNV